MFVQLRSPRSSELRLVFMHLALDGNTKIGRHLKAHQVEGHALRHLLG